LISDAKRRRLTIPRIDEGLDTGAVTGQKEAPLPSVPESEGEHAAQTAKTIQAPGLIGAENHLGVGAGPKPLPEGFELLPELTEVVDLSVEDETERSVIARHRLIPGHEIDDREPPVTEADRSFAVEPFPVGPRCERISVIRTSRRSSTPRHPSAGFPRCRTRLSFPARPRRPNHGKHV
jgi:hypothetical protein